MTMEVLDQRLSQMALSPPPSVTRRRPSSIAPTPGRAALAPTRAASTRYGAGSFYFNPWKPILYKLFKGASYDVGAGAARDRDV